MKNVLWFILLFLAFASTCFADEQLFRATATSYSFSTRSATTFARNKATERVLHKCREENYSCSHRNVRIDLVRCHRSSNSRRFCRVRVKVIGQSRN